MATASCSSYVSTASDITNFARLGLASQNELPNMYRELLFIKEPPHLLESHLKNNSYLSKNLKAHEWHIISTVCTNHYREFDVSLMYKIIRNLNLVQKPTQGWDNRTPPSSNEITEGDDVERIRRIRNEIVHRGKPNVTDAELAYYFSIFKDIANRLELSLKISNRELVSKIENAETCCIDKDAEQIYLIRLTELVEKEKQSAISVEEIQKSLTNITEKMMRLEIDMQKLKEKREGKNIQAELRIALIGKTGCGKSSTANTIIGEKKFGATTSSDSQSEKVYRFGRNIKVVELPCISNTDKSTTNDAILNGVKKAFIMLSPGPHAIILVVRIGRYGIGDRDNANIFVKCFQIEMLSHFFVIFTGADDLKGQNIHTIIRKSTQAELQKLIQHCKGRYIAFDNKNGNPKQAEELIEMIEENLGKHGGKAYSNDIFVSIEKQLRSHNITP